jgi:hypothetical protein
MSLENMKPRQSCKHDVPAHDAREAELTGRITGSSVGDGFRYPITLDPGRGANHPDAVIEDHLRQLLDLLVPMSGNRKFAIDGYRMLNDPGTVRKIEFSENGNLPADTGPTDVYEPRIGYIRRLLETLLTVVDLESEGRPVRVDGFRLKDLSPWMTSGGGVSDILAHAATRCNLSCRFCYNRGTTPALTLRYENPSDEYRTITRRIAHYVPGSGLNIFPDMASPCEMLDHPRISDILVQLREKTGECFRISTNGSTLTPQLVDMLAAAGPVYLDISINSASPARRRWLMRDENPEVAINAPGLLESHGIPYSLVIVPWPFPSISEMIDDLDRTFDFISHHHPTLVQISLPGYTRTLLPEKLGFGEDAWAAVKQYVKNRRSLSNCPIVMRPGLYEEYDLPERINVPSLIGVIENSPLDTAGIQKNDRIVKINGIPVKNRPQARSLLTVLHQSDLKTTRIGVLRDGESLDIPVDLCRRGYPYLPEAVTHLGAVFSSGGIPESWMDHLRETVSLGSAKSVLLLTSRLIRPALELMISKTPWFSTIDLHLAVPENRYFGGNISMGDLLVVEDIISAVKEFITDRKITPDLIVLPASPFHMSGWGRDLTGRVWLDIERALGIPVALVPCDPLFD